MPIDALLRSSHFDNRVRIQDLFLFNVTVDRNRPGARLKVFGQARGLVFIGGEFVVIVVVRHVLVGCDFFIGGERTLLDTINFSIGLNSSRWLSHLAQTRTRQDGSSHKPRPGKKPSPIQV